MHIIDSKVLKKKIAATEKFNSGDSIKIFTYV